MLLFRFTRAIKITKARLFFLKGQDNFPNRAMTMFGNEHVYVRLRLHEETRSTYDIEPLLITAQKQRDPNAFFLANRHLLETRASAAMTPEEALQKYRRCIVLGDPGAGKSTLLNYLTLKSIDGQLPQLPCFPVHITLSTFASSGLSDLIAFAAIHWSEAYRVSEQEAYALIYAHLDKGEALLLLDALDETVIGDISSIAKDSYDRVLNAITRLTTQYPQAHIVVATRKAGYLQRTRLIGFTELDILDFRQEDIEQFISNWFAFHPAPRRYATATDLISCLKRNPRIEVLAANPLLLSLIVLTYEVQQDLPERRADLYKQCLDTFLFKWDTSRDIRRRRLFKAEHKYQLLIEIAWHFHCQGRRYFPEDELLSVISRFLPTINLPAEQSKLILQEIEEENGLLKEQAHGWHGFLHLTLQEYCTALFIHQNNRWQELLIHCGDPWWEEVLSLYAGITPDVSPLISQLLRCYKQQWFWHDVFSTHLLWAGQCLAARPRITQIHLRSEVISCLITLLGNSNYSLIQENVTSILRQISDKDIPKRLLALFKDSQLDEEIRGHVVWALGELGDKSVVPDLLTFLKDSQLDKEIRGHAARVLGELGDKSVVSDLLTLLKDRQLDEDLRWQITWTLGKLGDKSLVPDLLTLLKDSQLDEGIGEQVVWALGKLGDESVVSDLLALLKESQLDEEIRCYAARALGELGDKSVVSDLLTLLKESQFDEGIGRQVTWTLGKLGDKSVVPDLLALLKDSQLDEGIGGQVLQVVWVLGKLGDKSVVPDLFALLKDSHLDKKIRRQVVWVLGKLGNTSVTSDLIRFYFYGPYPERDAILANIVQTKKDIYAFACLLKKEGFLRDDIHRTLWTISRREKYNIYLLDWKFFKSIRVRRWSMSR